MTIIYSEEATKYSSPGHPESPYRIKSSYKFLKERGFKFIEPIPAKEEDITLVHSKGLVELVKSENFYDPDTPALHNIFYYATLSAGGAIMAMELALKNEVSFSLLRPPGHHAGRNFLGGFCYFNNIAIAVRKSQKKTAVLDIDCHHGNGTEDIFLGDEKVLYISLHRYGFFYPGTGGESHANAINFPMGANTTEKEWLQNFSRALELIKDFAPELLAVSAGFDTYKNDPIAGLGLEVETYYTIGKFISQLNLPTFCVLEGGYSDELPRCIYNFFKGLSD